MSRTSSALCLTLLGDTGYVDHQEGEVGRWEVEVGARRNIDCLSEEREGRDLIRG